jgi:hypothetical protein
MKGTKYLSEVFDKSTVKENDINLIVAKTGQGKTTLALNTLPETFKDRIRDKRHILFLIGTSMAKSNIIKLGAQEWGCLDNKINVMTYNEFGGHLTHPDRNNRIYSNYFDMVIADEFHTLYKYALKERADLYELHPNFNRETLNHILVSERQFPSNAALDTLERWSKKSPVLVFAMTATPQQFMKNKHFIEEYVNEIRMDEDLIVREIIEKKYYTNIYTVLEETAEPDNKRLIHVTTANQIEELTNHINNTTERKAIGLWSKNNQTRPLNEEQKDTVDFLLANEEFPQDVDDILITEAYQDSWNLKDEKVKTIIVHSGNIIVQEQVIGRNRLDTQQVYLYDSSKAKNSKKEEKKKDQFAGQDYTPPQAYISVPLSVEDKDNLIQEIKFPKKWTSYKKWLEGNGYTIKESRKNNTRYVTIKLKE